MDMNNFVNNAISKNAVKVDYKPFNTDVSKTLTTLSVQIPASVPFSAFAVANISIYLILLSKLTILSFVDSSSDVNNIVVSDIAASKQSKAIVPLREPSTHV